MLRDDPVCDCLAKFVPLPACQSLLPLGGHTPGWGLDGVPPRRAKARPVIRADVNALPQLGSV